MSVQVIHRPFTVEEYHKMIDVGILCEDDRVELVGGEIIKMSPIGSRHAGCVNRLNQLFVSRLGNKVIVSVRNPINLSVVSEPEPDVALLRHRDDFYAAGHAEPADVYLIVEVCETTLDFDRNMKLPEYAQAGIREAWLVILGEASIEVYREPTANGYRSNTKLWRGDQISSAAFPGLEFTVNEILG